MIIKTTDVWTEQYPNHYECVSGAFIDSVEKGFVPYDKYKILLSCNCKINVNNDDIIIGNKHNAIIFYKDNAVIRLVVLTLLTDVFYCLEKALNQKFEDVKLKDIFSTKNIKQEIVDLKEKPIFNKFNNSKEMDICSCDRMTLLNCMLNGSYTESKTVFGNYDCNEYDFVKDIQILYELQTDNEVFKIYHNGAFINRTKTRAIIIQKNGSIKLDFNK